MKTNPIYYVSSRKYNLDQQLYAVEPAESPVLSGGERGEAINITLSSKFLIITKRYKTLVGPHLIQGIGSGIIPTNLELSIVDEIIQVSGGSSSTSPDRNNETKLVRKNNTEL